MKKVPEGIELMNYRFFIDLTHCATKLLSCNFWRENICKIIRDLFILRTKSQYWGVPHHLNCQASLVNQVALITQSSTELALTGYINWIKYINLHYCVYNWSPVISFLFSVSLILMKSVGTTVFITICHFFPTLFSIPIFSYDLASWFEIFVYLHEVFITNIYNI